MTDPNDPWADLYQDLGLTTNEPAAQPPAPPPPAEEPAALHYADAEDGDTFALSADEEAGDDGPDDEADGEPGAEGAPGEEGPKKRRRRRRRRKKKGPGDAVAGEPAAVGIAPVAEAVPDEVGFAPADDDEAIEPVGETGEEVSPEMTRDLIANWNVPSWSEIVAGLHRPER